jgi:uncharacterized protein with FMN-binding domain
MSRTDQSSQLLVISNQAMKKLLLSSLVVVSFLAYTVRDRLSGAESASVGSSPTGAPSSTSNNQLTSLAAQSSTSTDQQSSSSVAAATRSQSNSLYKDGQYTGAAADAYWGNVQVEATISSGKISDVQFLDYPHDRRTSAFINSQAMPWLTSEAIQAQSARVNVISGATLTSEAFIQSLQSALSQAKNIS